jgi:hypothetical protein
MNEQSRVSMESRNSDTMQNTVQMLKAKAQVRARNEELIKKRNALLQFNGKKKERRNNHMKRLVFANQSDESISKKA